ncbi:unnamed protein product [Camellia sinensis]
MAILSTQICSMLVLVVLGIGFCSNLGFGHEGHSSGSSESAVRDDHAHHHCDRGHGHHHHHDHHPEERMVESKKLLPEELAEEEDLKLYGFGFHQSHYHHHDHHHHHEHGASELSGAGLWIHAVGCSLLAGAMLGDAFLHQLPHAFGMQRCGEHSHSHDHDVDHAHFGHEHSHSPKHAHTLKDLSVGLSVLAGIVLFLLVEKTVRYVEENSKGANAWNHTHHHHHHKNSKKLKDDNDDDKIRQQCLNEKNECISEISLQGKVLDGGSEKKNQPASLRKRKTGSVAGWSRTLFLLAHELPQEGDFGILVRSGFSVSKALFFNFLTALVALAGTALEFTAGGFVYIAVAGVLAEMNNGSSQQ